MTTQHRQELGLHSAFCQACKLLQSEATLSTGEIISTSFIHTSSSVVQHNLFSHQYLKSKVETTSA